MNVFLFAKQIVDMWYSIKILDIIMVICAAMMCVYQFGLIRPPIKTILHKADIAILLIAILLTGTYLRAGGLEEYVKLMSALLMYFLGRICYDRITECYRALAISSYIIVYLNLGHRIWHWGSALFRVKNAGGDFYYYDTDMAYAMILAMVFIFMYGHNSLFKLFTVFGVCPYMVYFSEAGVQMVLMLVIYVVFAIYVAEKALKKQVFRKILLGFVGILMLLVVFCYLPLYNVIDSGLISTIFNNRWIDGNGLLSRYENWSYWIQQIEAAGNGLHWLLGTGMAYRVGIESLYVGIYYTIGLVGAVIAVFFLIEIVRQMMHLQNRKLCYVTCIMCILLLGTGVMKSSMDRTQMSWFPMLYMGMMYSISKDTLSRNDSLKK